MTIRELRVRYELETAMGRKVVHAVVCSFQTLMVHVRDIKRVGYKIVGIDERFRDDKEWMELDEGWQELTPIIREVEV